MKGGGGDDPVQGDWRASRPRSRACDEAGFFFRCSIILRFFSQVNRRRFYFVACLGRDLKSDGAVGGFGTCFFRFLTGQR